MHGEVHQVIGKSPLFEGLSPELINEIALSATCRTLGPGEAVYQKGDQADALWGVLSGRVVVEIGSSDGKEMALQVFGEGEVFGEVSVLDFGPRLVEARATQKSELFRIERKRFLLFLQSSPELCFRMFSLLCSHVRNTTEILEDTALYKLHNRLAKRLTLMASESAEGGSMVVHAGQSDLANMLGVNREAVNRHLRKLEQEGLITLRRQEIEILDLEGLSDIASPRGTGKQGAWGGGNFSAPQLDGSSLTQSEEDASTQKDQRTVGLLAIDAAEYSRFLMSDVAGTLRQIKQGLDAVERLIDQYNGHTVWDAGDRVLAEFPGAKGALNAALAIQEYVSPARGRSENGPDSLFRIGVHYGRVLTSDKHFFGVDVNTVIGLTRLSGAGGIAVSAAVRNLMENREQLELRFLGDHELKNVSGAVPIYSVRAVSMFKMLVFRAETLLPRSYRPAAIVTALCILLLAIWFAGDRLGPSRETLVVSATSIAVMPFSSEKNPDLDYLVAGIPEEVRIGLSAIPGIRVIGRESSEYFTNPEARTEEIGRILKVVWLLRGSLEYMSEGVEARVQLINAASSDLVWEGEFQKTQGKYLEFGPEIVHAVAASVVTTDDNQSELTILVPPTSHPEAYALYLEARNYERRGRLRNTLLAIPLLQAAVKLDPSFAEAHAKLAGHYLWNDLLDQQEEYEPKLRQELASQSLQKALSLKPNSPLVLAEQSHARIFYDDDDGALVLAKRALSIDPNNTRALEAIFMVSMKRQNWQGVLNATEKVMRLEPLSLVAMGRHSNNLLNADRYQEVLSITDRALSLYPESDVTNYFGLAAVAKNKLGDRLGAIESYRQAQHYGPPFDLWTGLDHDWVHTGPFTPMLPILSLIYVEDYEQAREVLAQAFDLFDSDSDGKDSPGYQVGRGVIETLAGDYELAIHHFEMAQQLLSDDNKLLIEEMIPSAGVLGWSRQSHWSLAILFAYRKTGRHQQADTVAAQIDDLMETQIENLSKVTDLAQYRFLYKQAQFYAIEGRKELALEKLQIWLNRRVDIFTYIKWDPYFENLHGNPEFEVIVARVEAELAGIRARYHSRKSVMEVGSGLID